MHSFFSNATPHFGNSRPLPIKTDYFWMKTKLLHAPGMKKTHDGLGYTQRESLSMHTNIFSLDFGRFWVAYGARPFRIFNDEKCQENAYIVACVGSAPEDPDRRVRTRLLAKNGVEDFFLSGCIFSSVCACLCDNARIRWFPFPRQWSSTLCSRRKQRDLRQWD